MMRLNNFCIMCTCLRQISCICECGLWSNRRATENFPSATDPQVVYPKRIEDKTIRLWSYFLFRSRKVQCYTIMRRDTSNVRSYTRVIAIEWFLFDFSVFKVKGKGEKTFRGTRGIRRKDSRHSPRLFAVIHTRYCSSPKLFFLLYRTKSLVFNTKQ